MRSSLACSEGRSFVSVMAESYRNLAAHVKVDRNTRLSGNGLRPRLPSGAQGMQRRPRYGPVGRLAFRAGQALDEPGGDADHERQLRTRPPPDGSQTGHQPEPLGAQTQERGDGKYEAVPPQ